MDNKNDFDGLLIGNSADFFTDLNSKSGNNSDSFSFNASSPRKEKFVVHLDNETSDSFDYDFEAFLSSDDRKREQQEKEKIEQKREKAPAEAKGGNDAKAKTPNANAKQGQYSAVNRSNTVRRPEQAPAPKTAGKTSATPTPVKRKPAQVNQEKQAVRMKTRSARNVLSGFAFFLVVAAVLTLAFTTLGLSTIGDILAYNRSEESIAVEIEQDPTLDSVIESLHDAGLIEQELLCKLFARYRHFDGYTDAKGEYHKINYLSGVYYLEPKAGLEGMLNAIRERKSSSADVVSVIFPEGWTINQIFERLEKKGVCDKSKLLANLSAVAKQYDFYYDIKQTDIRYLGLEGYLFPDTYEFYIGENPVSVLKKLFDNSEVKWTKEFKKRAKELGYTRDEILKIASIIQREAANKSQMADISSVIHNRLNNSATYPLLQCNSTLDYVTYFVKPYVDPTYVQIYSQAYNTYSAEGLPPGPICNPGLDAIEAALYPSDTSYYFFCHNNDGKIYLCRTIEEFQAAWAQVVIDNR